MFTIREIGRAGYRKELASTPFSDIARIIALALAERFFPAESEARHRARDGTSYIEVVKGGEVIGKVELVRSDVRIWQWTSK